MTNINKFLGIDPTLGVVEVAPTATGGTGQENQIPVLDSTGRLDASMMPVGIAHEIKTGNASETITAKDLIYFKADGTVVKASSASGGHYCQGWAGNSASVGQPVTVNFEATITGLVGLTPDAMCYLGVAGAITQTVPAGSGVLYQEVGPAISATELQFTNAGMRVRRVA